MYLGILRMCKAHLEAEKYVHDGSLPAFLSLAIVYPRSAVPVRARIPR